MDSNNIFFKVIVGVVLVGYMAFIFYQSLKGGIAYKKEFENFKNSHKHYETVVDGGYWVWIIVAMAIVAFVFMFMANPKRIFIPLHIKILCPRIEDATLFIHI